jgi:hypothetical protein
MVMSGIDSPFHLLISTVGFLNDRTRANNASDGRLFPAEPAKKMVEYVASTDYNGSTVQKAVAA